MSGGRKGRRYSNAQCKKCGSSRVGWLEEGGRWVLVYGERTGIFTIRLHRDIPHDCADPAAGGFTACPHCGRHHVAPSVPGAVICDQFPRTR